MVGYTDLYSEFVYFLEVWRISFLGICLIHQLIFTTLLIIKFESEMNRNEF